MKCLINNGLNRKYRIVYEAMAAAASGLRSYTELDQRCIVFTIHLTNSAHHAQLCRTLFDTVERYLDDCGYKKNEYFSSGLASFVDVNGSKFTGADRDPRQPHCHGMIFCPHELTETQYAGLIVRATSAVRCCVGDEGYVVKSSENSVSFVRFDRHRMNDKGSRFLTLDHWVEYAQKDEVRIEASTTLGVYLPFDLRRELPQRVAARIESQRNLILQTCWGPDAFKIFRAPLSSDLP